MKRIYKVLILPAGSGMAIAAIKMMRKDKRIRVYSADADELSPGLYLSHKGYLIPRFTDDKFYSAIEKIVQQEDINAIIPALDTILLDFSIMKSNFEELGIKVIVSDPEAIKITRDKWNTYTILKDVIPLPKSFITKEEIDIDFPLFIKPRSGSGSQFAYKINSEKELNFFYEYVKNPIIQEYLPGKEYTIDCLADEKGNLLVSIPRERIGTKAGISTKGKIVKNKELENMAIKISKKIKFAGPFFFQAKEDEYGIPKLTEINARIAGTMCLSSQAGANIYSLAVRLFMGEIVHIPQIKYNMYMTRFWEEIYLTEENKTLNKIE